MAADHETPGGFLPRGGERLPLGKVAGRFAVRLRRGRRAADLIREHRAAHRLQFTRQRIDEFAVDAETLDEVMARVRAGNQVEFASHVYAPPHDPGGRFYLTDEITVQFEPRVSDAEIESLVMELGLGVVRPVAGLLRTYVFRVTAQARENPLKIAARLLDSGRVHLSEPNVLVSARHHHVPADSLFGYQWHLDHEGGPFLSPQSHIRAVQAWDLERGTRAVTVAVIDDSIDTGHTDFGGAGKLVAPVDFAGRDFRPLPDSPDDNHGTACAGVAVAEENGRGVVGVAPGCSLMPIRMSGIDDNAVEEMFGWAVDNGASVISCSWGPVPINYPLSLRQRNALDRAASTGRDGRGCVIVFAAGNSNRPVEGVVDEGGWPNGVLSGPVRWFDGFAAHEHVIAVSACTSQARKAAYSNWGAQVSVCAPSNNVAPDSYPEVTAPLPGWGVVTTDRTGPAGYATSDYTGSFGGTSSACPVVAGVAALVLSANPMLGAREVREVLESTADKIRDPSPDPQLGLSHGDYDASGHSPWFGYGRVNAFAAVTEARRRRADTGRTVRVEATPDRAIPDNSPRGLRAAMEIGEQGRVTSVRVEVGIRHTYRGDLRVSLRSPAGTVARLHDRGGGRADDLRARYDATLVPALARMAGEPAAGQWTLLVQDLALADRGRLERWALELDVEPVPGLHLEAEPGVAIPDDDPGGVTSSLVVDPPVSVARVEVDVDITHSYVGDLLVTLVSPSGRIVVLHDRGDAHADNIIRAYTGSDVEALSRLRGEPAQGTWTLKVADLEGADTGKLNRWSLRIIPTA